MSNDNRTSLKPKRGKFSVIGFISVMACLFLRLLISSCKPVKSLVTTDNTGYHSPTTKLIAVKPSRHSLAIFVPKTCLTTNQQATTGMNKNTSVFIQARHIFSAVTGANIYDGLIEPNTKAFTVNKLNRLLAVVKTRHPIFMGDNKLTNLIGGYHA